MTTSFDQAPRSATLRPLAAMPNAPPRFGGVSVGVKMLQTDGVQILRVWIQTYQVVSVTPGTPGIYTRPVSTLGHTTTMLATTRAG